MRRRRFVPGGPIPRGIVGQVNGGPREVITIVTESDEPIATSEDSETTAIVAS